jgi:hypothetical protein
MYILPRADINIRHDDIYPPAGHVETKDIEIQFSWIYLFSTSNALNHAIASNVKNNLMLKPEMFKKA